MMSIKKIIFHAFICIFLTGCKSKCPDTIIVYYMNGFVDTNINIPCSERKQVAVSDKYSETTEYDCIVINHNDFIKIKNYLQNMRLVPQEIKTEISDIDSRITVVYDSLAVSFGETYTKYGADANNKLVYGNEEVIYIIKSLSRYYNYFTKSELQMWFPEIKKYGIPSTYKHVVYEKFTYEERKNMTMSDSITQTTTSKIIFVDSGEK